MSTANQTAGADGPLSRRSRLRHDGAVDCELINQERWLNSAFKAIQSAPGPTVNGEGFFRAEGDGGRGDFVGDLQES